MGRVHPAAMGASVSEGHRATLGGGRLRALDAGVRARARVLRHRVPRRPRRRSSARSSHDCRTAPARDAAVPFFRDRWSDGRRRSRRPARHSTTSGRSRPTPSTTSARASMRTRRTATTRASSRPTPWPSRCACSCRAAPPASRVRPSTRSGTARSARCSRRARSTSRASGPATSCSTRGPTGCTTARSRSTKRCIGGSTAWCSPRAPGNVTSTERQVELAIEYERVCDLHHRRLPAAHRRRRARRWATTRRPTSS